VPNRIRLSLDWLLVLVPVSIVLEVAGGNELLVFLSSAGAILPNSWPFTRVHGSAAS
jgi:hypothetical protein